MRKFKLLFIFILSICTVKGQKTTNIEIILDDSMEGSHMSLNFNNGLNPISFNDSLKIRKFKISEVFYAPFATISIHHNNGQYFQYFIDETPGSLHISFDKNKSDNQLSIRKSVDIINMLDSKENPLNELYTNFFKNDPDHLDSYRISTVHRAELKYSDSLKTIKANLVKSVNRKLFPLIKEHSDDYYSFWLFNTQVEGSFIDIKDDPQYYSSILSYFTTVFPVQYRFSKMGESLEKKLQKRISPITQGAIVPLEFTEINGQKHNLKTLQSDYIILDFWATWCLPCMKQIPELKKLKDQLSHSNVKIIGISADRDSTKFANTITEKQMDWIHVIDKERDICKDFNIAAFPTLVIINRNGKIVYRKEGSTLDKEEILKTVLK